MKRSILLLLCFAAFVLPQVAFCQVNSGSNGSDGAFNAGQDITVDMADHPDGIYQYTSVWIPAGVKVTFRPNAKNTPVVWLVQGDCSVDGSVDLSAQFVTGVIGSVGGAGGYNGGSIGSPGQGPGAGSAGPGSGLGGNASYGTKGTNADREPYGNAFLLPLIGGSGGGGAGSGGYTYGGGGGGGGAILIAASGTLRINGSIVSSGAQTSDGQGGGGMGSGGGIRLISGKVTGSGLLSANGASGRFVGTGGAGRIRIDAYENTFGGSIAGLFTQGFQPIIIPAAGQGVQLHIQSVAGNSVATSPSGVLANPDVIIPAQQTNPIPVVVNCTNIPLNTEISVVVHPANGSDVQAVGINNAGTTASSTATVSLNLPRGGGILYAKAVTGIAATASNSTSKSEQAASYAQTGLTADGERFAKVETKATLGGK